MGQSSALYGGEAPILLVRAPGWPAQAGAIGGVQVVDAMNGENRAIKTSVGRCQVLACAVRTWPRIARLSLGQAKSQGRTVTSRDNQPALLIHDPDGHPLLLLRR